MKNLLIIVMALTMLSCKKTKSDAIVVSADVSIVFKNTNGDNLLNANVPNAIKAEDIDVFVLRKGIKTPIFDWRMDAPKNFRINESETMGKVMTLFFDLYPESFENNKVVMYIRYKDGSEDKVTGEFNADRSINTLLKKVWFNDVLKWESVDNISLAGIIVTK